LGLSRAHGQAIESTPPLPETPLPVISPSWTALDDLLTELSSELESLSAESTKLQDLLAESKALSAKLSSELDASRTQAAELSTLLASSETSLTALEASMRKAHIELWVWRFSTVAGLVLAGWLAFR